MTPLAKAAFLLKPGKIDQAQAESVLIALLQEPTLRDTTALEATKLLLALCLPAETLQANPALTALLAKAQQAANGKNPT